MGRGLTNLLYGWQVIIKLNIEFIDMIWGHTVSISNNLWPVSRNRVSIQKPHRRSGLATLPSVGAVPYSPHIIYNFWLGDLLCFVFMSAYCMYDLSVYYLFLQYFDTVGWVYWLVKIVSYITYTVLVGT